MDFVTAIGSAAALCSMASFVPQAWKVIQTRDTQGISAGMYGVSVLGFSLWLAYGLMRGEWPLIVTNGVCLALSAFILVMKLLPSSSKIAVAKAVSPESGGTHR